MADTIAALATAPGKSAIGILRMSGDDAIEIASAVFRPQSGRPLHTYESRRLVYGTLCDRKGRAVDLALATISRAPDSYTGEDTAEFHCHGSLTVLEQGLDTLFARGARQALAGEFTKRAFLNGRLNLIQAEAVADLIDAKTPAAARNAALQLSGAMSEKIEGIYNNLVDLTAHFHAVLDYPDEEIDPFDQTAMGQTLVEAARALGELLATVDRGRILIEGIKSAIIGRANSGKSSLLNALLGYERAIVTPLPGTTRDTIEEFVQLDEILLRLVDTAGLRKSQNIIEQLGIKRTRAAIESAELIFLVLDGSMPLQQADLEAMEAVKGAARVIAVINKADLPVQIERERVEQAFSHVCLVSAKKGEGLGGLSRIVAQLFATDKPAKSGEILTSGRQAEAVGRALSYVTAAREGLAAGVTPDAVLADVDDALGALGEITGRSIREDITMRIFERFCVGK